MREGLTGQRYRVSAPLERTDTLMRQACDIQQGVCTYVCVCEGVYPVLYVCVGGCRQGMCAVTWSPVCWCSVQLY